MKAKSVPSKNDKLLYWTKQLEGSQVLELSTTYMRPLKASGKMQTIDFIINEEVTANLALLSKKFDTTLLMNLLTCFSILLHRYSEQDNILIATSDCIQNKVNIKDVIVPCLNTMILRQDYSDTSSFEKLLNQVKNKIIDSYDFNDMVFEEIADALNIVKDTSRAPLVQAMFILNDNDISRDKIKKMTSKFDITLSITKKDNILLGSLKYATDLFSPVYITSMIDNFKMLLDEVNLDSQKEISQYEILSQVQKNNLLFELNKKETKYDASKTIQELFESQVTKTPDNIAVVFEKESLTYKCLNERSNQLAQYLIREGACADKLIAICVERSIDMIVGLLAILKAGGAYLPIDPAYPRDRIEYTLEDSKAEILLTHETLLSLIPETKSKIVCLDTNDLSTYQTNNPKTKTKSKNLAYVIYTSGTTGKPKGVMLEHTNIQRLFQSTQDDFKFDENDVWTFFHSFAFDFAVWEIWGALLHGGKLVIVPYEISRSPEEFYKLLGREKITILNQTPSAFKQIIEVDKQHKEKINSLRKVIFGGEKLEFSVLSSWYEKYNDTHPLLVNMYGITETTVHTTYKALYKEDVKNEKTLIGKTLKDLSCYILNKDNQLVPQGVAGELYISGPGLARGYLNQVVLTDEKFIPNPFETSTRMYKAGDLVRYTEDGDIEYLGRIDDQVKIRGFRIELGEIEQQLIQLNEIKEAVVLANEDNHGEKALVGYVITANNQKIDTARIKINLSLNLPEYMLPSAIVFLKKMPLTSNGKVDKKALAKIEVIRELSREYMEPRNDIEVKLSSIFSEVFKIKEIGIYDDFFELGGHSLLSVQLIEKVNKFLNIKLVASVLFQAPTVEKLGIWIKAEKTSEEILVPIQIKGNKRAIFGLPGAGGSTVIYKALSEVMGETQPFYGLDMLYPTSSSSAVNAIVEIAKANVKAIKSIQRHGPYRLIGYCMGSLVAYEMAKILKDEIESIIMLNTSVPQKKNYKQLFQMTKSLSKFEIKKIFNKMSRMQFFSFAKHKLEHHSKTQIVPYAVLAYDYYRFKPMKEDLNISLLFIKDKNENMQRNSVMTKYGWSQLIEKNVSVNYIDGEHLTVLLSENVQSLKKTIDSYYSSFDEK